MPRRSLKGLVRPMLPKTIAPHRIIAGPLRGLRLVTSWQHHPAGLTGRTERGLLNWFADHVRPGETWLDVGAYYGYTAFALARLTGPGGRIFAFEPVAATAGYLDRGRELNGLPQITIVPLGLGAADTLDIRRLPLTRGMADSTYRARADPRFVTVPIARFDWLWPLVHKGDPTIHGVKIDVQGMECEVLTGMREALQRWRPRLVIELHPEVSRTQILGLLDELGYSSCGVAVEPARGEQSPLYLDDRSYAFEPV